MQIVQIISMMKVELEKGHCINLENSFLDLKNSFSASYDSEERFKQIIIKTPDATLRIFKTGSIIINSKILNSQNTNDALKKIVVVLKQNQQT